MPLLYELELHGNLQDYILFQRGFLNKPMLGSLLLFTVLLKLGGLGGDGF